MLKVSTCITHVIVKLELGIFLMTFLRIFQAIFLGIISEDVMSEFVRRQQTITFAPFWATGEEEFLEGKDEAGWGEAEVFFSLAACNKQEEV